MSKNYKLILTFIIVVAGITIIWQFNKYRFNSFDYIKFFSKISEENNNGISNHKFVFILRADYFNCSICQNSLLNTIKLIDSYNFNRDDVLIVIVKSPDGKIKFNSRTIKQWARQLGINHKVLYDESVTNSDLQNLKSKIFYIKSEKELLFNYDMPLNFKDENNLKEQFNNKDF